MFCISFYTQVGVITFRALTKCVAFPMKHISNVFRG